MPVTIARTAWIDDDGSGTTGTVINNAEKTLLYNQIDQGFALLDTEAGGDPIDVPFNAADYIPTSPMTLTITAGNVVTNCYSVTGKLVTWSLVLAGASFGGTASNGLTIKLPGGFTMSRISRGGIGYLNVAGQILPAQFSDASASTAVIIYRADTTNYPLGTFYLYTTFQFWKT